ncbi:Arylsulfatase [Planctomycetes bacterium CA13]|uniref:Arylsulfatase n=1 Tax=Novipirellula herctigrandis TaxID=2527986 RepID=A0A5C5Z2S5_9BACT|nr:Arylsulfatase [Planctomycetes bacterium CA13]
MKNCRTTLLCAAFALLSGFTANAADHPGKPNILFILIDDMGWPDLACYGHPFHETPVIDSLAAEGVRFTDFYATPVCSSSRSTIESGQNSARTGITDFLPGHWRPFEKQIVPPMPQQLRHDLTTPGEALRAAGYVTGYFGKWHLGRGAEFAPDTHGYQHTEQTLKEIGFIKRRGKRPAGPKSIDLFTDQAVYFLENYAGKDKPFFLHLSHRAVHIPIQAREETIAKYVKKEKPESGVNHPVYAAMIEDLDTAIGKLLNKLDELKLSDNTAVVLASDNGGLVEVYTGGGQIVSTNAPLRSEKGTIYEGGIRVPLIVKWPGVVPKGKTSTVPTATWDLLPTFCAMGQAKQPTQTIDGVNLMPLLENPTANLARDAIYFHYPHYHHSRPASAMRQGNFKLIEWLEDGRLELYDLNADIGESTNLAASHPERTASMAAELKQWRTQVGAKMPIPNPKANAAKAHLWYSRSTQEELDIKAFGDRFEKAASKPYFRRPQP